MVKHLNVKYKKPVKQRPTLEKTTEDITISYDRIFKELKASKREVEIAKNISKITLKDIL